MEDLAELEGIALTLRQQVASHKYVDATRQRGLRVHAGDVMLAALKRQAGQLLKDGLAALKPVPLFVDGAQQALAAYSVANNVPSAPET